MPSTLDDYRDISGEQNLRHLYGLNSLTPQPEWEAVQNQGLTDLSITSNTAQKKEEPGSEVLTGAEAWLQTAGQAALLTPVQESVLAQRIESARAKRDKKAEQRACEQLIASNLRLVAFIARRYVRRGVPIEDLMQEGTFGLLRAVERYEWRKGHRFSTYASWWIRSSITRALADQAGLIRLPAHVSATLTRVRQMQESLSSRLSRTPTQGELASAMGMTEFELSRLQRGAAEPMSFQTPIGEEGELNIADLIPAGSEHDPVSHSLHGAMREAILAAMADLDLRESRVLSLRYGLNGDDPMSLDETSREMRVTRERVRKLEMQALKKLRGRGGLQRLLN